MDIFNTHGTETEMKCISCRYENESSPRRLIYRFAINLAFPVTVILPPGQCNLKYVISCLSEARRDLTRFSQPEVGLSCSTSV